MVQRIVLLGINIVFILLIAGFLIYTTKPGKIDLSDTYVDENIELYFSPSDHSLNRVLEVVNSSQKEIHCALRSLNFIPLENLFEQKEKSGVKVRLYVDSDYMGNKRIYSPYLRFAPPGFAMMHNNYCIFDDEIVMTGSMIFNNNTMKYNFHDIVIINSTVLADAYSSDFWRLYNNQTNYSSGDKELAYISDDTFAKPFFFHMNSANFMLYSL
jgi:phosphatidylserine/phosphatidylglycerophosphate/cardiolipin synthase-like enzyme